MGNKLLRRVAEALAIAGNRTGALSLCEVGEMLNLSINEGDGFLKERDIFVTETLEGIEADTARLEERLAK